MSEITIGHVAEAVESFDEFDVYTLGLARCAQETETFAFLLSIAEPDVKGDGVCVVVEPGQRTAHAAVEACELGRSRLALRLTTCGRLRSRDARGSRDDT
jgi:hypothetical protein